MVQRWFNFLTTKCSMMLQFVELNDKVESCGIRMTKSTFNFCEKRIYELLLIIGLSMS